MTARMTRYLAYLNSSHWANLREQKFKEVGKTCQHCQSCSKIRVHHIRYHELTDVPTSDLLVLCEPCHDLLHVAVKWDRGSVEDYGLEASMSTPDFETRRDRIQEKIQAKRENKKIKGLSPKRERRAARKARRKQMGLSGRQLDRHQNRVAQLAQTKAALARHIEEFEKLESVNPKWAADSFMPYKIKRVAEHVRNLELLVTTWNAKLGL